jgi:hypothetical protein
MFGGTRDAETSLPKQVSYAAQARNARNGTLANFWEGSDVRFELITTEMGRRRYVRPAADSDRRTDVAKGPKSANTRRRGHHFDHLAGTHEQR